MTDKDFKLHYDALTFPSGEVQAHDLIITAAPSKEKVVTLFNDIMCAPTSTLHSIEEVTEATNTSSIRTINFPASRK
jgi:hypothetical protein